MVTIKIDPLDRLFSQYIRARDGRCLCCGVRSHPLYQLECAHVYGRASKSTRWDEQNAYCLCHWCHHHYTVRPDLWEAFCREKMGDEAYEALGRKARLGPPADRETVRAELKRRLKELEAVTNGPR